MFQYADDSSLVKVIKRKEDWIVAAEEISADLNCVSSWGRVWNINFEALSVIRCVSCWSMILTVTPLYLWMHLWSMRLIILRFFWLKIDLVDSISTCCQHENGNSVPYFWGQKALLLLISLLWDLSVNMAVLPSWVLQPPIYLNLTLYRRCGWEVLWMWIPFVAFSS